jgi:hypothetical protein
MRREKGKKDKAGDKGRKLRDEETKAFGESIEE